MAYVNPSIEESERNKFGPTGETTPLPGGGASPDTGSVGAGGGGGGGAAPSQATPTQFGSSASKLSDYLSANAPQVEKMGTDISGKLNTQYGQLQGDINKAGTDFGSAVQGGYAAPDQNLVNRAVSDPTGFVKNPNDVTAFQKQMNNSYTGPQHFEDFEPYGKVQSDVSNAVQGANLLNSTGGLSSYLQNQTKGTYTPGMNTLDTTLLQANPNASQRVREATKPYEGLTDYLSKATQSANQLVDPAKQAAQKSAIDTQASLKGAVDVFGNKINTDAAKAEKGRNAYNTQQAATNAQLTPIQQYLQQYQGASGYQIDNPLTSYLSQDPVVNPITAQNFSTPEQYAQAQALQQLSGDSANLPIGQSTIGLAGTAPSVPIAGSYNLQDLVNKIANDATNAQYSNSPYERWLNPNLTVPSKSQQIADIGTQPGFGVANPMAYETLLSQLMASSAGNITGNANGPNFYNVGPLVQGQPDQQHPLKDPGGSGGWYGFV